MRQSKILLFIFFVLVSIVTKTTSKRIKQPNGSITQWSGTRVIGGQNAAVGFAPYQVSLQYRSWQVHFCGGAIIAARYVLTASHCVQHTDPKDIAVVTGTIEHKKPNATYYVESVHIHCNYDYPLMSNDIALLRLITPIEFNEVTKPVKLPTAPLKEGAEIILTGWGSTELWGETPDILQKVTVNYVPYETCKQMLNNDPDLDWGHLCTFSKEGEGACHGDSGGPLVDKEKGELVGLVNWGYPCAKGFPDAHASPLFYYDWIRNHIGKNSENC